MAKSTEDKSPTISPHYLLWPTGPRRDVAEELDNDETTSDMIPPPQLPGSRETGNARGAVKVEDIDEEVFEPTYWLNQFHMDYALQGLMAGGEDEHSWEMRHATWLQVVYGKDIAHCSEELGKDVLQKVCLKNEPQSKEAERTARLRRALCRAFRTQHPNGGCKGPDCLAPYLCQEGRHIITSVFSPPNHWVGVAICNLHLGFTGCENTGCEKRDGHPSIVIMDSIFSGRAGEKLPKHLTEVVQDVKVFLHNVFSFASSCTACETALGSNGTSAKLSDSMFRTDSIHILTPRVPQQVDTSQCGPMSVLSMWAFLNNAEFAKQCLRAPNKTHDGSLCPYTHEDAVSLREYIRIHWELDRIIPNKDK